MAAINGSNGPDRLTGTDGADVLYGFGGNDSLSGLGGDDVLDGGPGNDGVLGGDGNDRLIGGPGRDRFDGGAGIDWADYQAAQGIRVDMAAGTAAQTADPAAAASLRAVENVLGSSLDDRLSGDEGGNVFLGFDGNDILDGRGGNDLLDGGGGGDLLIGGAGNDQLIGGPDIDEASYVSSSAAVTADLGAGQVTGDGTDSLDQIEALTGSSFGDSIQGGSSEDLLHGGGGNDSIAGALGFDLLTGGAGDDTLSGGEDGDTLNGGPGNDILDGGEGGLPPAPPPPTTPPTDVAGDAVAAETTIIAPFPEGDWVAYDTAGSGIVADLTLGRTEQDGDGGQDSLRGISDLIGSAFGDRVTGTNFANSILGGGGGDTLDGRGGADFVDGGGGNDSLIGGAGQDNLQGLAGNDLLQGGDDADLLDGGGGGDTLVGGPGSDDLTGGDGNDVVFAASTDTGKNGGAGENDVLRVEDTEITVDFRGDPQGFGGPRQFEQIIDERDQGTRLVFDTVPFQTADGGEMTIAMGGGIDEVRIYYDSRQDVFNAGDGILRYGVNPERPLFTTDIAFSGVERLILVDQFGNETDLSSNL